MGKSKQSKNICITTLLIVLFLLCAQSFAANGDKIDFPIGQRARGQNLADVYKWYYVYGDTSASTCHDGYDWCIVTDSDHKLMHLHNGDCSDLTSTQKSRANIYIENERDYLLDVNRQGSASNDSTCHSWAFSMCVHLVGNDIQTWYNDECVEINESEAEYDDYAKHSDQHSSKVEEVDEETCTVTKIISKMGWYGVYITVPDIYDGITSFHKM